MPGQPFAKGPVRGDFRLKQGIGGNGGGNFGSLLALKLAIGKRGDLFASRDHAGSPSFASSASRPLTSRELSVPTGQPTISAASLYDHPSTITKTTASR